MITHGTPTGHDDGCRGANCQNHHTALMTCTEAWIRYRGDWAYMRAVDAGTATTEKATYAKPGKGPRVIAETKEAAAKRPPRAKAVPSKLRAPVIVKGPTRRTTREHGTLAMYQAGCHKRDECPKPEGETCSDVILAYGRAHPKPGKNPKKRTKPQHGTPSGYQRLNCRKDCPAEVSCSRAASAARARLKADKAMAA